MTNQLIRLLRPRHYLKNLFVFLPLFFSGEFHQTSLLAGTALAFVSFCLISSSVYVFNDIMDRNDDRNHPVNKNRPIAAGRIRVPVAYIIDIFLTAAAFLIAYFVNIHVFYVILGYKLLNIAYSTGIKNIPIFDMMVIAVGFVLRLYAGSEAAGIYLTEWIIIMTFLLSMLIAIGKRRNDVVYLEKEGILLRSSARNYNLKYLNFSMIILSSVVLVAYIMYTRDPVTISRVDNDNLYITSFWVIAGILRYLQLIFVTESTQNPVMLLITDHPLKIIIAGWLISFLLFIYVI